MEEQELDVPACLILVRQGDDDAARAGAPLVPAGLKLVRAHRPKREGEEEDMVQMVFVKMFAKLDQFSATVPLSHWVSRIAVNTCLNQIASEKARPELRYADLSEEEEGSSPPWRTTNWSRHRRRTRPRVNWWKSCSPGWGRRTGW